VVCTFLALLELIRLKQLACTQPEPFAEIEISRAAPPAEPVENAPVNEASPETPVEETSNEVPPAEAAPAVEPPPSEEPLP
jgi:chromatin segregation and condensation protein Rec8/ScpA/Scc1 (kleisin family)